jgi:prephenate dehydrogenase
MAENDLISNQTIAIFGLGLMGGSLALALRGKCQTLIGIDLDPQTRAFAVEHQIVDLVFDRPDEGLHGADVIILATPISAIIKLIADLPKMHPGEAIVLDIGSTKVEIIKAMERLPNRFAPIGGHPISGKETLSIHNADQQLFQETTFVFTPVGRTPEKARRFAEQLAISLEAKPVWLSAEDHDQVLAATSHSPYLLAAALAAATPTEYQPFMGPGYHSTTRLAATPTNMMLEIIQSNHENVMVSLESMQVQITSLITSLHAEDYDGLRVKLEQSAQNLKGAL